eukprot:SAG31_NODE_10922_length_1083_cov_1.200203_1_plen_31_part_10
MPLIIFKKHIVYLWIDSPDPARYRLYKYLIW